MATVVLTEEKENQHGEKEFDQLNMEATHINGLYRFIVKKETITTHKEGWRSVSFTLFANGNFNYTITQGRKSQKKLDTLNQIIEDNKDTLYQLWLQYNYSDMCSFVKSIAINKKVA